MELLKGRDIQSLVTEAGRMSAGRAAHFLRQACESLAEAHEVGIVHRDLKPANLFVCQIGGRTDFLKVLDFGLVAFRTDPKDSTISGTPAYLAPEVVSGDSADARSDVYGLGAIAYFLLTGRTVFDAEGVVAMLHAQVHESPRPPSNRGAGDVPEGLEALVLRCLLKDPAKRPKDAAALLADVQELQGLVWTQEEADAWWRAHPLPEPATKDTTDVALLTTYPAESSLR
jgi:serine/threonine protein kinase